jgi:dihydroorotase
LDTLLPLTLRLVQEGIMDLPDAIARLTSGPAEILGLPLGRLDAGYSADICIFDPQRSWELNAHSLRSQGHNTPFLGWEMQGMVRYTLFKGRVVFEPEKGT